jgi:predicted acyltransferase
MDLKAGALKAGQRLESLDALRGFDMFWIIGGEWIFGSLHEIFDSPVTEFIQHQLRHAEWEGFRFWDLIMPLFLFIVGVAMPFSFAKRLARGDSRRKLYFHIIIRFVILFILGMIAQGHLLQYDLSKLHPYSNTLQAIAAGYLIGSILLLNLNFKWQIGITGGMLLLFWALMAWVPVPGYGAGRLTPEGNPAMYLDKLLLGSHQDGTNYTWILSSITFACTVMLGVMGGLLLRSRKSQMRKVFWLFGAGIVCVALGSIWSIWFPIIKHLWTSSFVLYSGGICFVLLGLFYLVIDVWGFRRWAFPFKVIGMNAIFVYMITRLFDFRQIGNIFVGGLADRLHSWNALVQGLAGFLVIWLILFWMYRKKTFVKI